MRIGALILILGAIAAYFGQQYFSSAPEITSSANIVTVNVPELSGAAKMGETAFDANCALCHGKNAAGLEGRAPPLVHKIYEPNHHGNMAFVLAVKNGVRQHHWPFGNMPPVEDVSDGEVANIITYVRTLQRANGIN